MDLAKTIEPKSDQLNADDLLTGPIDITITDVRSGSDQQPINISYQGDNGKPWRPCKSMIRVMVGAWGREGKSHIGKSLRLFADPKVKWGGAEVGGIRISYMTDIDQALTIPLTVTRGRKVPWTVMPLVDAPSLHTTEEQTTAPQTTPDQAQQDARQAAEGGADAFSAWWNTDYGKSCREQVKPIMDELKGIAARADGGNHNG